MQIKLEEDSALEEMEVLIRCPRADGEAQRLLALLRAMDGRKLTGEQGGQTYLLDMGRCFTSTQWTGKPFCTQQKACLKRLCGCMSWKIGSLAGDFSGLPNL